MPKLLINKVALLLLLLGLNNFGFGQTTVLSKSEDNIFQQDLASKLISQAKKFYSENQLDTSKRYAQHALAIYATHSHLVHKEKALFILGHIHMAQNFFVNAISDLEQGLVITRLQKNDSIIAQEANNLAVCYRRIDNNAKALLLHNEALLAAQKISDQRNIAKALNSSAIIDTELGSYSIAKELTQMALELDEKSGNLLGVAINYNVLAWIEEKQGHFDQALRLYFLSLKNNLERNDSVGIAICTRDIGFCFYKMKRLKEAKIQLDKAEKLLVKINNKKLIAETCYRLGNVFFEINRPFSADSILKKSLRIAKKIHSQALVIDCYTLLSKIDEMQHNFKSSLKYLRKASEIQDSINKQEYNNQIAEFVVNSTINLKERKIKQLNDEKQKSELEFKKTLFQSEIIVGVLLFVIVWFYFRRKKQKKQNLLLANQNTTVVLQKNEIQSQKKLLEEHKKKLEMSNLAKDKLFSIIAHDLRSPFNGLINLSHILLTDYAVFSEKEKIEMIELISESAEKGYTLLENLLAWAKSQTGGIEIHPESLLFTELVEEAKESLFSEIKNKKIQIIQNIPENDLVFADKHLILGVLRNLVSNAIKFSFKSGIITIFAIHKGEKIAISVSDNGVGFAIEKLETLFKVGVRKSTKGTEGEIGTGLGLVLCKEFVTKCGGEISAKSTKNLGATFTFTLPTPGRK